MTDFLTHILQKINDTEIINNPWNHIVIPEFLPPDMLIEQQRIYDSIDWSDHMDDESNWCNLANKSNYQYNDIIMTDPLKSNEFAVAVFNKFEQDFHPYVAKQSYKLDLPSNQLQPPHRDKGEFMITLQIFLQEEEYADGGTILMSDYDTDVIELPLRSNYCSIFFNNEISWHRVQQRGYIRKSFMQRWIAP